MIREAVEKQLGTSIQKDWDPYFFLSLYLQNREVFKNLYG